MSHPLAYFGRYVSSGQDFYQTVWRPFCAVASCCERVRRPTTTGGGVEQREFCVRCAVAQMRAARLELFCAAQIVLDHQR